ncbi:MAG: helix-turn-helix transcriptional regulator [Clostridia bacterium]|nr:helix-turn-helix transcriptional regulator [Clostridia bacterium]
MKDINISKNISDLRKKKGITQEQLATALNISPQAVSKWETNTSQPDTQTLPMIAGYFEVSIDYLFYGEDYPYKDIYNKIWDKVAALGQQSKEAYNEALTVFSYAHHGIGRWNNKNRTPIMYDEAFHLSNENGLSLLSGKGYGAIVTRDFFENINQNTVEFAQKILPAISTRDNILVCLAIISMSDISFEELKEKLNFDENTLRVALDCLISAEVIIEKKSKHKALGFTYEIHGMYHTCLCVIFATLEMQRYSLVTGVSCCMGYGDYPIEF